MTARTADDVTLQPAILAHYERVGAFMEAGFGGDPIVFANYPAGLDQPPAYHITVDPLSARKLLWLVHRMYALEYHGWAPLAGDENRLRFARVLLECSPSTPFARTRTAALALRKLLQAEHLDAVALLDGRKGVALWIPLADAPRAEAVRAWLHPLCDRAVATDSALFTTEPNTVDSDRVHLHVSSNARHRFSALPYSLRGDPNLEVCTPVAWDELAAADPHDFTASTFAARIERHGDVFAREVARFGEQRLPTPSRAARSAPLLSLDSAPRGHVIVAAIEILEDDKRRTADQILAEALARRLVPPKPPASTSTPR